jgi:1,4-dihydroxy-2-naphthoate octaprenyltransferase
MANTVADAEKLGTPRRSAVTTFKGLVRLSKITVYQHYYGLVLAWLILTAAALHRPGVTAAMLLFLLASMGIVTCACSADDVVGYRNGSDAANYKPGDLGRDIRRKPLLSGAVTEREAVVFVAVSATVAASAGVAAFTVLGWHVPVVSVLIFVAAFVFTVQYSAGLRLSYILGGTEILLCLATASGLLFPYLAVERRWSAPAVTAAFMLGMWLVMVSTYSNVNDKEGDAAVGRRTLAAATRPAVFKTAMVFFYLISVGLVITLALATYWPWWTLLTLAPAVGLHTLQLYLGPGRDRWLIARKIGFLAYDVGFAGLLIPAIIVRLS